MLAASAAGMRWPVLLLPQHSVLQHTQQRHSHISLELQVVHEEHDHGEGQQHTEQQRS